MPSSPRSFSSACSSATTQFSPSAKFRKSPAPRDRVLPGNPHPETVRAGVEATDGYSVKILRSLSEIRARVFSSLNPFFVQPCRCRVTPKRTIFLSLLVLVVRLCRSSSLSEVGRRSDVDRKRVVHTRTMMLGGQFLLRCPTSASCDFLRCYTFLSSSSVPSSRTVKLQ